MDDLLKPLGQAPPPAALGQIGDAIMAAWSAEQRDRATQARVLSAAALVAPGLDFAGGSSSPKGLAKNSEARAIALRMN